MMTFLGEVDRNIKIFIFRVSEKVRFFPLSFRERVVSLFFCTYNAAFPEKLCTYTHTFLKRETTARERTVFCTLRLRERKSFQRVSLLIRLIKVWREEKISFYLVFFWSDTSSLHTKKNQCLNLNENTQPVRASLFFYQLLLSEKKERNSCFQRARVLVRSRIHLLRARLEGKDYSFFFFERFLGCSNF